MCCTITTYTELAEEDPEMREAVMRAGSACPTELAMEVVGGKWKLVILEHLTTGVRRFSELQRAVPTVTARMLTRQLRELEADKLVRRTVYPEVPPRVEYSLTTVGRSLEPLVDALRAWGEEYRDQHIPVEKTQNGRKITTATARYPAADDLPR